MSLPLRPAVAAGEWVAISGQVGVANGVLVEGGISAEIRQGLANLVAVLEANGLTPADVVKTNVFLVGGRLRGQTRSHAKVAAAARRRRRPQPHRGDRRGRAGKRRPG